MNPTPISEFKNKCAGINHMWNQYPNNEVAGYLTADGQIIITATATLNGGGVPGIINFNGQSYYASSGTPKNTYLGSITNRSGTFIPVIASIHTHTPCRQDDTDGTSHQVGLDDKLLAQKYPTINHWVVGYGSIAQFNSTQNNFFNKHIGALTSICNQIN
ncbi:hypothetical protein [Reichenbachiella sp. MSK19-1]|uniref:hypothetical protein n=1 Tax=Reichenbachiella sp. MSK19-1 TaxID=1897631 RepID=UPI000E6D320E|nr:hypothetical protein [Reichenbachiella sp. MSK19-1]RJE74405.1 hypothetical protein BGP76_14690 [Reichenbachiella sp. MSK19-1]